MLTADLTALEAIGVAVRRELDAALTYHGLAERCGNPLARERFQLLEEEARHHEQMLLRRHGELAVGAEPAVPRCPVAPAPEIRADQDPGEGLLAALRCAADAARRAREFYLDAAATAGEQPDHAMFRFLADVHARHHMELEAEYDLVLRYPHALDDPQAPWRAEGRRGERA